MSSSNILGISQILSASLCPIVVILMSSYYNLGIEFKVFIGVVRSFIQLMIAGYFLLEMVFASMSPIVTICYLSVMLLIAALEATGRQTRTFKNHFYHSVISVVSGGLGAGIFGSMTVFLPNPWYNPRVVVPTIGMLIGNAVSGPSLAVDRLLSDITEKTHEAETRLAFGANKWEAMALFLKTAMLAAITPTLNVMNVVGLVSIPGMMTGQLLGGASPLSAAQYQMAILWLITGAAAISTQVSLILAIEDVLFDKQHRLTVQNVVKRATGKVDIDKALIGIITDALKYVYNISTRVYVSVTKKNLNGGPHPHEYELVSQMTSDLGDVESDMDQSKHSNNPLSSMVLNGLEGGLEIDSQYSSSTKYTLTNNANCNPSYGYSNGNNGYSNGYNNGHNSDHNIHNTTIKTSSNNTSIRSSIPINQPFLTLNGFNIVSGRKLLFDQNGLNMDIHLTDRVALCGKSGIGKTRLLRAIAQLDPHAAGTVTLHLPPQHQQQAIIPFTLSGATRATSERGVWEDYSPERLGSAEWRRRCLYVPQALPPMEGTPLGLLEELFRFQVRKKHMDHMPGKDTVASMESELGLAEGKLSAVWSTLSGGERQRAAIAVALLCIHGLSDNSHNSPNADSLAVVDDISKISGSVSVSSASMSGTDRLTQKTPKAVLLLDEPTAACDNASTLLVESVLVRSGVTMIFITHDEDQAYRLANKILRVS